MDVQHLTRDTFLFKYFEEFRFLTRIILTKNSEPTEQLKLLRDYKFNCLIKLEKMELILLKFYLMSNQIDIAFKH